MSLVRRFGIASVLVLAACGGGSDSSMWTSLDEQNIDSQPAQQCTAGQPDPRACDPADAKKTTVCHIPPGNPANMHTICVGNAAVPAHMAHGDVLGSCCPLMTGGGDGGVGTGGGTGTGGGGGTGTGGGGGTGTGGGGGTGTGGGGGTGTGGGGGTGTGGGGGAGTGGGGGGGTGGGTAGADMGSTGGGPIN